MKPRIITSIFKLARFQFVKSWTGKYPFWLKWTHFFVSLLIVFHLQAFGQCPKFNSGNISISVDKDAKTISLTTTSDINFSTTRVKLYDFSESAYYYDSWRREHIKTDSNIKVRIFSKEINVSDLPAGDFTIVVEVQGCKEQALGLDYSGFPYSAIKID